MCLAVRFCRDAANIVDLLSAYEKRHIVQFLSCDLCDHPNHQSSAQCCVKELHECFAQYRHTVYLTGMYTTIIIIVTIITTTNPLLKDSFLFSHSEHPHDKFPASFKAGVVVTNIEAALQNLKDLIGFPDIKDLQKIIDGVRSSRGQ